MTRASRARMRSWSSWWCFIVEGPVIARPPGSDTAMWLGSSGRDSHTACGSAWSIRRGCTPGTPGNAARLSSSRGLLLGLVMSEFDDTPDHAVERFLRDNLEIFEARSSGDTDTETRPLVSRSLLVHAECMHMYALKLLSNENRSRHRYYIRERMIATNHTHMNRIIPVPARIQPSRLSCHSARRRGSLMTWTFSRQGVQWPERPMYNQKR